MADNVREYFAGYINFGEKRGSIYVEVKSPENKEKIEQIIKEELKVADLTNLLI
ncbi:MAG: hypothetical protein ABH805_01155 [Candidatus Nealsonbacteria bacterium]